jgi:hypothetical protein
MKPITAETCTKAWLQATQHLQRFDDWRDYTVILEITAPMQLPDEDKKVYEIVDSFLADKASIRISTVINTIFPATLFARHGADGVFKEYPRLWPKIKKHVRCQQWGTYADRIIQGSGSEAGVSGPLKTLIEKLRKQLKSPSPKRGAYEIGTLEYVTDIAVYRGSTDSRRIMGGPCLSHLSFKLTGDRRLMLTALYRSHYYIYRALGNLYALAWLQHFVAREVGIETASLVCHSTMARLDTLSSNPKLEVKGWGTGDVKTLIARCTAAMSESVINP